MLKLTHLSRRLDKFPWQLLNTDGWLIRFTGDGDEWSSLKDELKAQGWSDARWLPEYAWDDGKEGAWWVEDGLFRIGISDRFKNLSPLMLKQTDESVQWFYKGRRGWEGKHPSEWYRQHYQSKQSYPAPLHLKEEYALLGIGGNATIKEIKEAYRTLAKTRHPDAGGTHLAFILLQQAYEKVIRWAEMIAS